MSTTEARHDRPDTTVPAGVVDAFERAVSLNPEKVAVVQGDRELTYAALNTHANQLAAHLVDHGLAPDDRVAIHLPTGIDAVIAAVGVLKAGGAYVPLDPAYPAKRLEQVLDDATPRCVVTTSWYERELPGADAVIVRLDGDRAALEEHDGANLHREIAMSSLAYVIFTSGSTGRPKGVMVEHGNLANFLAGMDEVVPHEAPGRLLSVTSPAFDISVLEILWTLVNGFEVTFEPDPLADPPTAPDPAGATAGRPIGFSLFSFGVDRGGGTDDHLRLLTEAARFADAHDFEAVWTPERHFHDFGANHPNPSVTSAALATLTERIALRAGSVVLPLHHPARVAEEWALVDRLSGGRVGVSFAPGWQPGDFVLRPGSFTDRRTGLADGVDTVRRLWRGEAVPFTDPTGATRPIRTMPRPVQPELPVWLTAAGSPDTFRTAGEIGANVLTHLLGQTVDELAERIEIYRAAWREHGHGPGDGHITVMVHTFVGDDDTAARDLARSPMRDYVDSSLSLIGGAPDTWGAFKRRADGTIAADGDIGSLDDRQRAELIDFATERFIDHSGLFGTPATCVGRVERLRAAGVDEIACLVDFGLPTDTVLDSLTHLDDLRRRTRPVEPAAGSDRLGRIAELLTGRSITHLQCVPSMARALVEGDGTRDALAELDVLLVGGERFPGDLARRLRAATRASIHNMYGPTETTIWSSTEPVDVPDGDPSIGRPILNTTFHVLDEAGEPVATGEEGELWIGGAGVARGYLGRPDLTAERFVPDRFTAAPDARLYRTGDLVRRRADGRFDIIGRSDQQVKIRGNRIELGEIENLLHEDEAVRDVAVLAIDVSERDRRLVAFVTARDHDRVDVDGLRATLMESLPDYMVPSRIVEVGEMPLTPNGKIDRRTLAEGGWNARRVHEQLEPPTSPTERTIARVWADVLGLDAVGAHDDFYELGGHSLIAIEAHHLLSDALGKPVAITDLLRHPTVRKLADHLDRSSASRIAPPGHDPAARPLSFAQERLWVIDQLDPGSAAYIDASTVDIDGPLDAAALRGALDIVVARHEILRTSIVVRDGRPSQVVAASVELPFTLVDVSRDPPEERRARSLDHVDRFVAEPFDLSAAPLMRALLIRHGDREHVLTLAFHHTVIDGASVPLLLTELARAYDALRHGTDPDLAPVVTHYGDFAGRQRAAAASTDHTAALEFWRDYLEGIERPAPAPTATATDHRAGQCSVMLDAPTTAALRRLAREERATPFTTFLAALGVLLHRTTGSERFAVGSPVAERGAFGSAAAIGPFINVLPLRVDLAGEPTFRDLVRRVRDDVLSAIDRADVPFQQIVSHVGAHHDPLGSSLFDVIINYEPDRPASARSDETTFTLGAKPVGAARVPLEVYVDDVGDRATLRLHHALAHVDEVHGRSLIDALTRVIEAAVTAPDRPVGDISLVGERARAHLPDLHSPPTTEPFASVPDLVAEQARRHPDRIAVVAGRETCTYADLDAGSLAVATEIARSGVGQGDVVAIDGERSIPLVTALLGVLRAGAVVLLLDPGSPRARTDQMRRTADVAATLTVGETTRLEVTSRRPPRQRGVVADRGGDDRRVIGADDPAYVIFTSGSTGTPKAVLGRHRGLSHFVRWQRDAFGIGATDRSAQLTAVSFDVVLRDILTPLVAGAELHLPPPDLRLIGAEVLPWLAASGITMLHTVPSLASFWADGSNGTALDDLRLVFFAGEPLHDSVVDRWRSLIRPGATIVNLYGPTETTLATCFHIVPSDARPGVQPIGRPIPGTEVWVSHRELTRPCGIGEPGEIVVRSPYRTAGYLGAEPDERSGFVANPYADDADDLVYRTGDIGVLEPDGTISCHGRIDHQVKLRGQRIEPAEIEAALRRHADVAECAVAVIADDRAGDPRLVAHVVPVAGHRPQPAELRRHMASLLPAVMVPNTFAMSDGLPRLASGKIDRGALPAVTVHTDGGGDSVRPDTDLEALLTDIWTGVIGRRPRSRQEDFFDAGGHSLLGLELVARIEQETGRPFPVSALLRASTVELQALVLSDDDRPVDRGTTSGREIGSRARQFAVPGLGDGIIRLTNGTDRDRIGLLAIPGRGEHPIRFRHLADALGSARDLDGIVLPLLPDTDGAPTVEAIAAAICAEIGLAAIDGPIALAGYSSGAVLAYEVAQRLAERGVDVAALVLIDPALPTAVAPRTTWARRKYLRAKQLIRGDAPARMLVEPFVRTWNQRVRRRLDGRPTLGGETDVAELVMMDRAHHHAARSYRPEPYAGVLTLIRRDLDESWYLDSISAWGRLGTGGSNIRVVSGDHVELLAPPHVEAVAGHLAEVLRTAEAARAERRDDPATRRQP